MDCPACNGKGKVTRTETHIDYDPEIFDYHLKHHAYTYPEGQKGGLPIGANCDCPRVTKKHREKCIGCNGEGIRVRNLRLPEPGDKVTVTDKALLTNIFGEGHEPDKPGVVLKVELDNPMYEFVGGYAIHATWDKLGPGLKIPKDGADLWAFGITEIKVV